MISALAFHIFISESKQLNTLNNKSSLHKYNYIAQFALGQLTKSNKG